jgi:hypothetical protein
LGPDGEKLPAKIVPAANGSFAWLFFEGPMPGGAVVTLHVDGTTITAAADGVLLDANGDGVAGGMFTTTYRTVSLMPLLGTSLSGKIVDPGSDLSPMTFDDIRAGADGNTQQGLTPNALHWIAIKGVERFASNEPISDMPNGRSTLMWEIVDLPGGTLGFASGNTIYLDYNAAGWGWFIDPKPADDTEFNSIGNQGEQDRMDLFSVVMHELGHFTGHDHTDEGIMAPELEVGKRIVFADDDYESLADNLFSLTSLDPSLLDFLFRP